MSLIDHPGQEDQALVSVRPRLRTVGRGGSIARVGQEVDTLSRLYVARPAPLRPPLVSGLQSAQTYSGLLSKSDSCPGPVQQLLQQQLHNQHVPRTERDRQIAMVEEELSLTRRMIELEKREHQMNRMVKADVKKSSVALHGFGKFVNDLDADDDREDMFEQIEKARREELEKMNKNRLSQGSSFKFQTSKEVTKQKVSEMLQRKKREMRLRNGNFSSTGSSLKDSVLTNLEVQKNGNEVFNSDEESESSPVKFVDATLTEENYDMVSLLGEDISEQQMLWERIQRERSDEEDRVSGMKHNGVVQEQLEILRKIQEQNSAKKKEEQLTFKLIADMSLNDQRQPLQRRNVASAPREFVAVQRVLPVDARAAPTISKVGASDDQWSVVGARAKEKMASLKLAAELETKNRDASAQLEKSETAIIGDWRKDMLEKEEEERRRQIRNWKESQKVRVVKSVDSFQEIEDSRNCTTLRDILMNSQAADHSRNYKTSNDVGGRRELGARRKSEGLPESEGARRKATEDLRLRTLTQEREIRSRVEKEALEREWELATRRTKLVIGASEQEESGQGSRHAKLEQRMNQKLRRK